MRKQENALGFLDDWPIISAHIKAGVNGAIVMPEPDVDLHSGEKGQGVNERPSVWELHDHIEVLIASVWWRI